MSEPESNVSRRWQAPPRVWRLWSRSENDITFVTKLPVTFFLIAFIKGRFYIFFIQMEIFFVTVLYGIVTM